MPVALNISTRSVQLVSARGNTVEKWETRVVPPGAINNGQILQPSIVADVIKGLFDSLKLPRKDVLATITGMSFTHRVLELPKIKPSLVREAIERATQKEIHTPLNELYLDWQVLSETSEKMEIFVLGVPRTSIDALLNTLNLANVELTAIDIKPLAVARTLNEANALIVDFEPDYLDIIVISQGMPVTLHTMALKSNSDNLEDQIYQLTDELIRTIDYYNLTHKENPVFPGTSIVLCGSLVREPSTVELISKRAGRPVSLITNRFTALDDFSVSSYAASLGLILKETRRKSNVKLNSDSYLDINVNLLSGRKRTLTHQTSLNKLFAPLGISVFLILLIPISMLYGQVSSKGSMLQTRLENMNRVLLLNEAAANEAKAAETTIDSLNSERNTLLAEQELISGKGNVSTIISVIFESLPENTNPSGINIDSQEISIDGEAKTRIDVIQYARDLEKRGGFTEVRIALLDSQFTGPATTLSINNVKFKIVIKR